MKKLLLILLFHSLAFAQFSGGIGSGDISLITTFTNCTCFYGDSASGYNSDTVYLTYQVCPQLNGGNGSGYDTANVFYTNCGNFYGDSSSGYNSDTVYLTYQVCPQLNGGNGSGYNTDSAFYTNCGNFTGDSASGYDFDKAYYSNCPNYYGNIASGYSSDFITCVPLPVIKIPLQASYIGNDIKLLWEIYGFDYELLKGFDIERKIDSAAWEKIATVKNNRWDYLDNSLPKSYGFVMYKIKATEFNGEVHYSNYVLLRPQKKLQILVYPNPVKQFNTLYVQTNTTEETMVGIYSMLGTKVFETTAFSDVITIPVDFSAGLYLVRVRTKNSVNTFKIIVIE